MSRSVPTLPPQFAKLAALYLSSTFKGERDTARRKAEAILPPEAGGFERALRIQAYHDVTAKAGAMSFMAGFDEFTEIDNPGHIAREQAKRVEKRRKEDARRAELLAEFGSFDAVLKPCTRERALLAAVKPWRKAQPRSRGRWTESIAGFTMYDHCKAPAEVVEAIKGAIPWPTTYAEARAEMAFWRQRDDDMQLAITPNGGFGGDGMLDMPAVWRMWMVQEFAEHRLVLHTLPEIIERMRAYRFNEGGTDTDVEDAILRDLEALAVKRFDPLRQGLVSREELLRQDAEGFAMWRKER